MKKLTTKEIAEYLVDLTHDFTSVYCIQNKTTKIDRSIWASLHIGFISGLKLCGYSERVLDKALEIAQKEIKNNL